MVISKRNSSRMLPIAAPIYNATIDDCIFDNNLAIESGGAVYLKNS